MRLGGWFARWRRGGAAARVDEGAWSGVLSGMALLQGLSEEEGAALKALVERFLGEKQFVGAAGLEVLPHMALWVAAQACLPVLRLGLSAYSGWVSVILYPGEFAPEREAVDEAGVLHRWREPMVGEAWQRGPLVLSWEDALYTGEEDGVNVVIHECAHKLDMRNGGEANGFPPLPADMPAAAWSDALGRAYAHFTRRVAHGADMALDPYAAESPGEFFAVMSEAFFAVPHVLLREYPAVYRQLQGFYRQHPAGRLPA